MNFNDTLQGRTWWRVMKAGSFPLLAGPFFLWVVVRWMMRQPCGRAAGDVPEAEAGNILDITPEEENSSGPMSPESQSTLPASTLGSPVLVPNFFHERESRVNGIEELDRRGVRPGRGDEEADRPRALVKEEVGVAPADPLSRPFSGEERVNSEVDDPPGAAAVKSETSSAATSRTMRMEDNELSLENVEKSEAPCRQPLEVSINNPFLEASRGTLGRGIVGGAMIKASRAALARGALNELPNSTDVMKIWRRQRESFSTDDSESRCPSPMELPVFVDRSGGTMASLESIKEETKEARPSLSGAGSREELRRPFRPMPATRDATLRPLQQADAPTYASVARRAAFGLPVASGASPGWILPAGPLGSVVGLARGAASMIARVGPDGGVGEESMTDSQEERQRCVSTIIINL